MTAIDTVPTFLPMLVGSFDATGGWIVSGTAPPGLSGSTFDFRAYALTSAGKIIDSADETIVFD